MSFLIYLLWIIIYLLIGLLVWYLFIWIIELVFAPVPDKIKKIVGALIVLIVIIGVLTGGFPPLFHLNR